MAGVLIVDGANVVGSRADGWWRDRPGAAARLRDRLARADLPYGTVVLVLEGQAKKGNDAGEQDGVLVVHAPREGDDEIVAQANEYVRQGDEVSVVTADRGLRGRVTQVGASIVSPGTLLRDLER